MSDKIVVELVNDVYCRTDATISFDEETFNLIAAGITAIESIATAIESVGNERNEILRERNEIENERNDILRERNEIERERTLEITNIAKLLMVLINTK